MEQATAVAGPSDPPDPPTRSRPLARTSITWTILLVTATLHAGAAVAQPILAGAYLNGDADAMLVHGPLGSGLVAMTMLLLGPAALLFIFPGKGSFWPLVVAVGLFLTESLQIGMGHSRQFGIHIPLGVLIVGVAVALVWYLIVWRYRLGKRLRGVR